MLSLCIYTSVCSICLFCSTWKDAVLKLTFTRDYWHLCTWRTSPRFQLNTVLIHLEWHSATVTVGRWHTLVIQCPVMVWWSSVCTLGLKENKEREILWFICGDCGGSVINYVLSSFSFLHLRILSLCFWNICNFLCCISFVALCVKGLHMKIDCPFCAFP